MPAIPWRLLVFSVVYLQAAAAAQCTDYNKINKSQQLYRIIPTVSPPSQIYSLQQWE